MNSKAELYLYMERGKFCPKIPVHRKYQCMCYVQLIDFEMKSLWTAYLAFKFFFYFRIFLFLRICMRSNVSKCYSSRKLALNLAEIRYNIVFTTSNTCTHVLKCNKQL